MSDKELISRGAELVTGDLILHRKVMGQYRNGQFTLTPEGVNELENIVDVVAKEVPTTRKLRGKKSDAPEPADEPVAPTPAPADDAGDLMGNLEDILSE